MDLAKIKIYRVENPKVIANFKTMVGSNLGAYLNKMKTKDIHKFESFKTFLLNQTTFSENETDQIINNKLDKVKINKVY